MKRIQDALHQSLILINMEICLLSYIPPPFAYFTSPCLPLQLQVQNEKNVSRTFFKRYFFAVCLTHFSNCLLLFFIFFTLFSICWKKHLIFILHWLDLHSEPFFDIGVWEMVTSNRNRWTKMCAYVMFTRFDRRR